MDLKAEDQFLLFNGNGTFLTLSFELKCALKSPDATILKHNRSISSTRRDTDQ